MALFRPKYPDPKTGKLTKVRVCWYDLVFAGRRYRGSTKETRKTLVAEFEKDERRRIERAFAGPCPQSSASSVPGRSPRR